jgi:hypothetical protein
LEILEIMRFQHISQSIIESIQKIVLFLFIRIHITRGVMGQFSEMSNVLAQWHRPLLQVLKFFLLHLDNASGYVMQTKCSPELLPIYVVGFLMCINIRIPPVGCRSLKLVWGEQNHLSVLALHDLKFLFNNFKPVIDIQWLNRVWEHWWLGPLKLTKLVTEMRLWCLLVTLALMHIGPRLLHSLKHLGMHQQDLLQSWRGWQDVLIVGIGMVIPCVDHLMNW